VPEVPDKLEETLATCLLPAELLKVTLNLLPLLLLIEGAKIDSYLRRSQTGNLLQAGPGGRFKCARHHLGPNRFHKAITKSAISRRSAGDQSLTLKQPGCVSLIFHTFSD
jgi:hypothetical protein